MKTYKSKELYVQDMSINEMRSSNGGGSLPFENADVQNFLRSLHEYFNAGCPEESVSKLLPTYNHLYEQE